jgi:hypothetical protein
VFFALHFPPWQCCAVSFISETFSSTSLHTCDLMSLLANCNFQKWLRLASVAGWCRKVSIVRLIVPIATILLFKMLQMTSPAIGPVNFFLLPFSLLLASSLWPSFDPQPKGPGGVFGGTRNALRACFGERLGRAPHPLGLRNAPGRNVRLS